MGGLRWSSLPCGAAIPRRRLTDGRAPPPRPRMRADARKIVGRGRSLSSSTAAKAAGRRSRRPSSCPRCWCCCFAPSRSPSCSRLASWPSTPPSTPPAPASCRTATTARTGPAGRCTTRPCSPSCPPFARTRGSALLCKDIADSARIPAQRQERHGARSARPHDRDRQLVFLAARADQILGPGPDLGLQRAQHGDELRRTDGEHRQAGIWTARRARFTHRLGSDEAGGSAAVDARSLRRDEQQCRQHGGQGSAPAPPARSPLLRAPCRGTLRA